MSGNQLQLEQADRRCSPGSMAYLETWRHCECLMDLFIENRSVSIVLLLQLELVG